MIDQAQRHPEPKSPCGYCKRELPVRRLNDGLCPYCYELKSFENVQKRLGKRKAPPLRPREWLESWWIRFSFLRGMAAQDGLAEAIRRLAALKDPRLIPLLLRTDAETHTERAAVETLGQVSSEFAAMALTELLSHPSASQFLRDVAAETLRKLPNADDRDRAIGLLSETARAGGEYERGRAVEALAKLYDLCSPKVRETLRNALSDRCGWIREAAGRALVQNAQGEGSNLLLVELLGHGDAAVRRAAALEFGKISGESGLAPLIAALKDTDLGVRQAAATALSAKDDRRAIPALRDALPNVGLPVVEALSRLADAGAVPFLVSEFRKWGSRPERWVNDGQAILDALCQIVRQNASAVSDESLAAAAALEDHTASELGAYGRRLPAFVRASALRELAILELTRRGKAPDDGVSVP